MSRHEQVAQTPTSPTRVAPALLQAHIYGFMGITYKQLKRKRLKLDLWTDQFDTGQSLRMDGSCIMATFRKSLEKQQKGKSLPNQQNCKWSSTLYGKRSSTRREYMQIPRQWPIAWRASPEPKNKWTERTEIRRSWVDHVGGYMAVGTKYEDFCITHAHQKAPTSEEALNNQLAK